MNAGWAGWWPSVLVFLAGLLILAALAALVRRRAARTRRELAGWLGGVRTSTARLRAGDRDSHPARDRIGVAEVGRIGSLPPKGE